MNSNRQPPRQPLKQALKKYYASKSLSDSQLDSLQALQKNQQQLESMGVNKPYALQWMGSVAAALLLFLMAFVYMHTPAVISDAYADMVKDASLNNQMQSSVRHWMNENSIGGVPQNYPVEMSKFCHLDKYETTHLRVAGAEQGTMHLFFHRGKRPIHWMNRSGSVDDMGWKMIEVREGLTVIVLYTHDMRASAIQAILSGMLPGLQAEV